MSRKDEYLLETLERTRVGKLDGNYRIGMTKTHYKSEAKTRNRFEMRETRARNLIQLFSAISSLAYR